MPQKPMPTQIKADLIYQHFSPFEIPTNNHIKEINLNSDRDRPTMTPILKKSDSLVMKRTDVDGKVSDVIVINKPI